jgi:hypothetical protein
VVARRAVVVAAALVAHLTIACGDDPAQPDTVAINLGGSYDFQFATFTGRLEVTQDVILPGANVIDTVWDRNFSVQLTLDNAPDIWATTGLPAAVPSTMCTFDIPLACPGRSAVLNGSGTVSDAGSFEFTVRNSHSPSSAWTFSGNASEASLSGTSELALPASLASSLTASLVSIGMPAAQATATAAAVVAGLNNAAATETWSAVK